MAAQHGKNTAVFLNQYNVSSFLNEATAGKSAAADETTTFGAQNKTYIAGLGDGKATVKGLFDGSSQGLDVIVQPLIGAADAAYTFAPSGVGAIGNRCSMANVQILDYEATSPVGGVVAAMLNLQADGGIDNGVVLAGLRSTNFATTDNATSVDNGAATTNGGVAVAHLTGYALTGGNVTVKVQHSTDNTTWADLTTVLSAVSAVGSAVVYVAPGTTVNRYTRAQITTTGTAGTTTTTLSFARR